ncbi:MAG: RNA 2',3'-cyclic phosphodiesterase [Methylosarcina sp.]
MKRLFFALWPDENTRQACAGLAKTLSRSGGKPVLPENLHVTLVFLGGIDAETEAAVTEAASAIAVPKVAITFDRVDYWRKPRILCLTGRTEDGELKNLVAELNAASRTLGIEVDRRPYTPHVTLIRKAREPKEITFEPILWRAESFCLVESHTLPEGVEYRVIQEWKHN